MACAFVLRKLSDEIDKVTYAHATRVRYTLRLNIGLLSGLAVGWFIKPGAGDSTLISLSPLALAFVAGYGSDLFFVALDKVVQAFSPATEASGAPPRDQPRPRQPQRPAFANARAATHGPADDKPKVNADAAPHATAP